MRKTKSYLLKESLSKEKLLAWANQFEHVCFLDSNHYSEKDHSSVIFNAFEKHASHDCLLAAGKINEVKVEEQAFDALARFYMAQQDWLFGFLSYDLKNEIERLASSHADYIAMPLLYFFCPKYIVELKENKLFISFRPDHDDEAVIDSIAEQIISQKTAMAGSYSFHMKPRISEEEYLATVNKIKDHIKRGDIYELNYCQEFYAESAVLDPVDIYRKLNAISRAPFAAFFRYKNNYLFSASPERFLKKTGRKVISQPIKGTIRRGNSAEEDKVLMRSLHHDPKERSENVMIVDLVRNDLSRIAERGSVHVEELYGIYTFDQVHQMVSTVCAKLREEVSFLDAIKNTFPMGSMTGAPKVKAMELIENYEVSRRGLYSGAVGYINPQEDFDFNVVIRSILYNASAKYVSFMVGSAITAKSIPEKEYEECLLKAKAMYDVLNNKTSCSHA